MKRTLIPLVSYALIAACPITSSQGQNSSSAEIKTAIFAGGCFWCIQPAFDKAKGVIKTAVGYCGGTEPNPTYEVVSSEKTGYRESIQITYDPAKISYDQLLDIYWRQIDPTQADGQFTDIGPSYRAAIFYGNDGEKKVAEASKEKLARCRQRNFIRLRRIIRNITSKTRNILKHSRKARGGFRSKRKRGENKDSQRLTSPRLSF